MPESDLNKRISENSWSALECLAHLNLYGDFYLPEIENCLNNSTYPNQLNFKSGILGNYFAKSMIPKENFKKMKTFQSMNPIHSDLDKSTIEKFIAQQNQMLKLLKLVEKKDLTKTKTAISISKFIKLRLGDTFRVVIYHNWRHIEQAKKVLRS